MIIIKGLCTDLYITQGYGGLKETEEFEESCLIIVKGLNSNLLITQGYGEVGEIIEKEEETKMGRNTNTGYLSGLAVRGRPEEFNKLLQRQGQLVRLIHAKKCSCLKHGQIDLFCTLCGGKGYRLFFQTECDIFQEYSPHALDGDRTKINPFFIPISYVRSVQVRNQDIQGGTVNYKVESFDDTTITLKNVSSLPEMYDRVFVSYAFKNATKVENEECYCDGSFIIQTINTGARETHLTETLTTHGDIINVIRVYNRTKDYIYTVKKFKKNYIYLDDSNNAPAPLATDIVEVDYEYIPLFYAALVHVETTNSIEKWGEDVKIGDVRIVLPSYYKIGRGSIMTAMTTILQAQEVIIRGAREYDELPAFDVFEIRDTIEDEEGNLYTSEHFRLEEFNNLVWYTDIKPKQGIKYTVNYQYRPSYMVYRQQSKTVNLGHDGRYPIGTFGRFLNSFSVKDLDLI